MRHFKRRQGAVTLDVCLTFSFDLVTSRTETGTVAIALHDVKLNLWQ